MGDWFLDRIPVEFGFTEAARSSYAPMAIFSPDRHETLAEILSEVDRGLVAAFPREVLPPALADFYCFPAATGLVPDGTGRVSTPDDYWRSNVRAVAARVVERYIRQQPTAYAITLVGERLRHILTHVIAGVEMQVHPARQDEAYHYPNAEDCVRLLLECDELPEVGALVYQLVCGDWRVPITASDVKGANSYQLHSNAFFPSRLTPWRALRRHGRLDYDTFCKSVEVAQRGGPLITLLALGALEKHPPDLQDTIRDYSRRYVRALAVDLGNATNTLWHPEMGWAGMEWLVQACRHVEQQQLDRLEEGTYHDASHMIRCLASIAGPWPEEEATAADQLRVFAPRTLKLILPHATKVSPIVLRALGWDDVIELDHWVRTTARRWFDGAYDVPNVPDPESGTVDRQHLLDAIAAAGEPRTREYLSLMRASKKWFSNTLVLVEAVMGRNAKTVRSGLNREKQIAMKAFGLLPLTGGEDEALDRYRQLKDIERASREYGPDRRLNTRGAVEAALNNLAQTAGFADRVRMEWALEARLARPAPPLLGPRTVDDWEFELVLDAAPRVVVRKHGRPLKSTPAALKKHEQFRELSDYAAEFKAHARRMQASFEDLMIAGDAIADRDLHSVAAMPAAILALRALVLQDAGGAFGRFDPGTGSGETLDGQRWQPRLPVRIAHAWHLDAAGQLAAAQAFVMSRRIVQPFKQVFRELYVPAPAERDDRATRRFAGRRIEPRRAARLFEARQWRGRGSALRFERLFAAARLRAHFQIPDGSHYLVADEPATAGDISFGVDLRSLPLSEVPPIVFSEAVRDADLVVSAAALVSDEAWSPESARRRTDVARAICDEFKVTNVTFADSFAHITGSRARYRVHLGSGVVHREPGAQVCIIPPDIPTDPLFLPFAVDEDARTATIVGLVLLFANDARISDPALLAQLS